MKDKLHDISRDTDRNSNTHHDVIFDAIKPTGQEQISSIYLNVHLYSILNYFFMKIATHNIKYLRRK